MDSRPAKRQRKWTISSSDDSDDVQVKDTDTNTNTTTRPKPRLGRTAASTTTENTRSSGTRRLDSNGSSSTAKSNPKVRSSSLRLTTKSNGNNTSNATTRLSETSSNSRTGRQASPPPSFSSSFTPEKNKNGKSELDDSLTAGTSLHSYFRPATQEQRWSSKKFETAENQKAVGQEVEEGEGIEDDDDDFIQDDYDSYDEIFTQHIINGKVDGDGDNNNNNKIDSKEGSCSSGKNQRKPSSATAQQSDSGRHSKHVFNNSARRFVLPPSPVLRNGTSRASQVPGMKDEGDGDSRPWAQRYAPLTLEELAVHKRKVTDVGNWLRDVFTGKNKQRLLVLRGPAGCGKTTTVSLLSKSMGLNIVDWKNPSSTESTGRDNASIGAQFEEFLGRGDKFGSLDLDEDDDSAGGSETVPGVPSSQRRILLIEEFPTILSRNSLGLAAFRSSLLRYLAATAPSFSKLSRSSRHNTEAQTSPPVVIIVSETLLSSASSIADNFTVHRLLGPEIYNHPGTTIIDFNSVAPTFMSKALQLILEKEARGSKRTKVPGPAVLERISEIGDIRSAISSLEFLCLKDDKTGQWGGSLASRPKRTSKKNVSLTSMEKESLEMITQREASLGIFHAVGKIMYNKREDASLVPEGLETLPPPPDYLRHYSRPKASLVSVNELVDELGTDIQTFICALHENYVPSCESSSFTDCLDDCIETLSDSDILCADRRGGAKSSRAGVGIGATSFSAGLDMLRQEEISFQVASRGLLFSLPYPVNRRLSSVDRQGRTRDAFKMFYPTSLRLWNESERMEGLADVWTKRLLDPFSRQDMGRSFGANANSTRKPSDVRSWRNADVDAALTKRENPKDAPTMPVTMISRDDMLLCQLPFMAKISCKDIGSEIDELTGFQGIGPPSDVANEDDLDMMLGDSSADSLRFPLSLRSRTPARSQEGSQVFGPRLPPSVEEEEEKLVLSDDDIEDD